ncbi:N-terminal domain of Peptidase_S41 [Chitinophaga sp. YR573]|uniref:S41 family peptidase n=1 Tax=Chitinophaga sp. YR573 TaxID=1881040 RepID=UPI0008CCE045|nr:S41 family peptidase [Chitinophaga sp. YR573]SEW05326.1 N-terminal domain of Peptidase_S41 [Chitinophaga sp. YR573]
MKIITFIILLTTFSGLANAQNSLTANEKTQVIDSISKKLTERYVYPDVAEKMVKQLQQNVQKGNYANIKDPNAFADQLSKDLLAVCHDKHLGVRYDPQGMVHSEKKEDSLANVKRRFELSRSQNFGFKELKILDGNIGYLNLSSFEEPADGGATAVLAMNFLSNTDAIIIDLRNNGGGATTMVQLLASYFFDNQPHPLTDIYWRPTNSTFQLWTLAYVEGKRMPDVDVYVLTSKSTFSAAEDFCYSLQNLKRITIIGETTGGGAHPVMPVAAANNFIIHIPQGRSISSITKTDWEGTGVKPDIEVAAKDALITAQIKALEKRSQENIQVTWALMALKAKLHPITLNLAQYPGTYGDRTIALENGQLYIQKTGNSKYPLVAIADDLFMIENLPYLKIKMIRENDKITGLSRLYDDGAIVNNPKN